MGGGSSADWTTAAGYSSRGVEATETTAGPISEGGVCTTAETTPQGLPSHSERAIIAAHESNAMPTGPKNSHAARSASVNQRTRPGAMCAMLARERIRAHGNESPTVPPGAPPMPHAGSAAYGDEVGFAR